MRRTPGLPRRTALRSCAAFDGAATRRGLTGPRAAVASAAGAALVVALLSGCSWAGGEAAVDKPPTAPTGVTVAASSSTAVHVMWNRATDDHAVERYEVFRGRTKVETVDADRLMVDVTGLKASASYEFSVRALDTKGQAGPAGKRVSVRTLSTATEDEEPPTAPRRLRAEADGGRSAVLTWQASTDDEEVASYDIHQGTSKIHSVSGGRTSTVLTGLRPGTGYTFSVKARDTAGNDSAASNSARARTAAGPSAGAGTAPGDFEARGHRTKSGAHYIDLSWVAPRTGGAVTEYQIRLDGTQNTTLVWGGKVPRGKAEHSFYVGKEPGETHRVKLRARLPDGTWGGFSAERTVTTAEAP